MKSAISKINQLEIPFCLFFNRINEKRVIHQIFHFISRLGDGVIWYVIMALLPLFYTDFGLKVSFSMILTSLPGVLIYKLMKMSTQRPRPYNFSNTITQGTHALDQFSFPSGHTLHAVGLAMVLVHFFPIAAVFIIPFSGLIALSRLILGLHYPSDVLAGAALGYALALCSLEVTNSLLPISTL